MTEMVIALAAADLLPSLSAPRGDDWMRDQVNR
jgi:hypothetical protein